MKLYTKFLFAMLIAAGIISGCGKGGSGDGNPPDELLEKVSGEMRSVEKQRLDRYMPKVYAMVNDSFQSASIEITRLKESENGGSYEHAKRLLIFSDSLLNWANDSVAVLMKYYEAQVESLKVSAATLLDSAITISESLQPTLAKDKFYQGIRRRIVDLKMQQAQGNTQYKTGVFSLAGMNYYEVAEGAKDVMFQLENLSK